MNRTGFARIKDALIEAELYEEITREEFYTLFRKMCEMYEVGGEE
jgi:hypothetical protein